MITIKAELSENLKQVKIYTLADLHIGDANCDMAHINSMIEEIKNDDEAFAICNGDICNNATRNSVSDVYSERLTPMQEIQRAVELLEPIRDKILLLTSGNHEERTYREGGLDLGELIAIELGLADKFAPNGCTLFLRFGKSKHHNRKMMYTIYVSHGASGGRKFGSKINALAEMSGIVDADIFIHSHTHAPITFKDAYYRVCRSNDSVELVERLYVNTASSLDYGGYGQKKEYHPASKQTPIIVLDGRKRNMRAIL